jgi:hypothetical protein
VTTEENKSSGYRVLYTFRSGHTQEAQVVYWAKKGNYPARIDVNIRYSMKAPSYGNFSIGQVRTIAAGAAETESNYAECERVASMVRGFLSIGEKYLADGIHIAKIGDLPTITTAEELTQRLARGEFDDTDDGRPWVFLNRDSKKFQRFPKPVVLNARADALAKLGEAPVATLDEVAVVAELDPNDL